MGQTLTNGIYLPDEGERNSYSGLEVNWRTLDALILTVNGKAAPNIANTWTAAQTFTAGIAGDLTGSVTGDLTGTASKAIADEDGTSIKTGYGKLASANTWTDTQTYSAGSYGQMIWLKNTGLDLSVNGNTGLSSAYQHVISWVDKNNTRYSSVQSWTNSSENVLVLRSYYRTDANTSRNLSVRFVNTATDKSIYSETNADTDLGTSTNQWSSVYARSYYYNGTAWGLDKSNTWTEDNQFNSNVSISKSTNAGLRIFSTALEVSATKGQPDLTNAVTPFISFKSKTSEYAISDIAVTANTTSTKTRLVSRFYTNSSTYAGTGIDLYASTASKYLAPTDNNTVDLGTSTNKWKTLNGVNPGALGMPDYDRCVDKTSEIPVASLDGNTEIDINDYFPNLTGWINIVISDTSGNFIRVVQGKAGTAVGFNNSRSFHAGSTGGGFITLFMPIVAGSWKSVKIQASSVTQFRFYPCLGNV